VTGIAPANAGPTILVVDDEEDIRAAMRRILVRRGYTVLTAANSQDAQHLVRGAQSPIELLLTDVSMPGEITASELADDAVARHPGLRVLFVSGYSKDVAVDKGLVDPNVEVFEKPFTPTTLAAAVEAALDRG
jgi:hypothetical protein